MKNLSGYAGLFFLMIVLPILIYGQSDTPVTPYKPPTPGIVSTGMAVYWQTMTTEDKNTFLTGYLMSQYDLLQEMKSVGHSGDTDFRELRTNIEQTVAYFRINSYDERQRFIGLIDQYYKQKLHASDRFADALRYAHRILQYEKTRAVQTQ